MIADCNHCRFYQWTKCNNPTSGFFHEIRKINEVCAQGEFSDFVQVDDSSWAKELPNMKWY